MPVDDYVEGSSFEALFRHGEPLPDALTTSLRELGVDLTALEARYPLATWTRAAQLARQQLYPELPDDVAWRRLGRRFLQGFLKTLLGRLAGVAISLIPTRRVIERAPRHMRLGGNSTSMEVEALDETSAVLRCQDHAVPAEFMAGCFEEVLALRAGQATVTATTLGPDDYRLELRWERA